MNTEVHYGSGSMNTDTSGSLLDHEMYLMDFVAAIKDIDDRIFHSSGRPPCEIIVLDRFPGPTMPGSHIAKLVTFTSKIPIIYPPSVLMFPVKQECSIVWSANVSERLEYVLKRDSLSGAGDKDIKEMWFIIALAVARLRVLYHDEWFKGVKLRTRNSVSCQRELFSDGSDEVAALRKLLFEFDVSTRTTLLVKDAEINIDIYWTLRLVTRALERGRSIEEALEFLIHD